MILRETIALPVDPGEVIPGCGENCPDPPSLRRLFPSTTNRIADEIRDCVIRRNGGQADGPNTVSKFVGDAIGDALVRRPKNDKVSRTQRRGQNDATLASTRGCWK
jgi:hypothetical protein